MKHLLLTIMKPSILVGGQAVIEGVMMRVPGAYATAVRDPEGKVHVDKHEFNSKVETSSLWKRPIMRGMMALFESMKMGMKTLQWSADIAMPEEAEKQPGKIANFFSTLFAIVLAISMFVVAPLGLTTWLLDIEKEAVTFNLVSGVFRISFFILYLLAISLMKDVKRLFRYHGAEHKVVFNFESGKKLFIHCTFVSNSRVCHHRYYNHVYFWGYHCFSSDWISSTAHASGSRHILRTH